MNNVCSKGYFYLFINLLTSSRNMLIVFHIVSSNLANHSICSLFCSCLVIFHRNSLKFQNIQCWSLMLLKTLCRVEKTFVAAVSATTSSKISLQYLELLFNRRWNLLLNILGRDFIIICTYKKGCSKPAQKF